MRLRQQLLPTIKRPLRSQQRPSRRRRCHGRRRSVAIRVAVRRARRHHGRPLPLSIQQRDVERRRGTCRPKDGLGTGDHRCGTAGRGYHVERVVGHVEVNGRGGNGGLPDLSDRRVGWGGRVGGVERRRQWWGASPGRRPRVGHGVDGATHGWGGSGGLTAVEVGECTGERHLAVAKAVARAAAVAAAHRIPAVADKVVGGEATEAAVGGRF